MNFQQLETDIREFVRRAYPNIEVRVEPWADDRTRAAVYFTEAQFAVLYPAQRYHYLRHLIPDDYYERHLKDSEWFELAPGERPDDLEYPDDELIADITPDVMRALTGAGVFRALDDLLCPADASHPPAAVSRRFSARTRDHLGSRVHRGRTLRRLPRPHGARWLLRL